MEFNGVLVLAVVWILVSLLGKLGQKQPPKDQRRRAPRTRPPSNIPPLSHGPPAQDATQREGTRLELVLRELQRSLEEANSTGRSTTVRLPPAEELEERESLEVEPEVRSLEEDFRREVRRPVDQDEGAEQIEVRRIKAAADRDAPRVKADHVQFDKRIREEPADHTATQGYTARQLRDAVVWREILGPPASMRDEH
jgi:hypothetical protein